MKHKITAGTLSFLDRIFVQDLSQTTTVAGLTGLTNASAGLAWSYCRKGDTAATPVTLVAGTLGTYTSFNPSTPGAPSNTGSGTGGTIAAGTYFTAATWTANGGETAIGTASSSVTLSGSTSSITVTQPGSPPAGVTGWKVYLATSSGGPWYLAGGSPDINRGGVGTAIATTTITATSFSTSNAQPPASTTISGGGFIVIDGTLLKGEYEVSVPNPMITSGFTSVNGDFHGAANMGVLPFEIDLDVPNYQLADFGMGGALLPTNPVANTWGEALFFADLIGGRVGVAQAGAATTITLDASASSDAGAYVGDDIFLYGGTGGGIRGTGQRRTIIAYNTSTKVATVNRAWDTNPDSSTKFVTLPQPLANIGLIAGDNNAANNQKVAANDVYQGSVTGGTPSTTTLVDTGLTSTDANAYNGRVLIFSGNNTIALARQGTIITGWNAGANTLTFNALTRAPAVGDTYRMY